MRVVVCFTTANQGFLDNLLCQVETLLREVPLNALLLRKDLTCWDHIHANEQLP